MADYHANRISWQYDLGWLGARVTDTFVRGHHVLASGALTGQPQGRYLHRPTARG